MIAVYAGSFSPPTKGHLDIIRRSAAMFDQVVVAVLSQEAKRYLFSPEERREMLCEITKADALVAIHGEDAVKDEMAEQAEMPTETQETDKEEN